MVNTAVNCSPWAFLSVMRNLRGTGVGPFFDPNLPVDVFFSESQVMARYSLNLAQSHVKAGKRAFGEIFIRLGRDQISQRGPEIKGLGRVLQGGIDLRGAAMVV